MISNTTNKTAEAIDIFRHHGGIMRTAQAIRKGIHPRTLYAMRDEGIIVMIDRGIYRLADMPLPGNPDLVTVARKIPRGVICLVSALAYHGITNQIPHEVQVAIEWGTLGQKPRLNYPPIKVFWYPSKAFSGGIQYVDILKSDVRIYSPEKTLADCFKFRNKIGVDIAIEALKLYKERMRIKPDDILRYARICRVEKVMKPYLEAIL